MDEWGDGEDAGWDGDKEPEGADSARPGPVYDLVVKGLFEGDLAGACRVLGVPVVGEPVALSAEFPMRTRRVDLIVKVGPRRLLHVEYVTEVSWKLVPKMLFYRGLIMTRHKFHHVDQRVVVLGGGTVRGHDDYAANGFALNLRPLYLRDADPEQFLDDPHFAPLAILHRTAPGERAELAARVIQAVRKDGGDRVDELLQFTTVLAAIASDRTIVERMLMDTEMTWESIADFYRDTQFGHIIRDSGREEGRDEGREEMLTVLLVERFGEQPDLKTVAHRLAHWSDMAAAAHAILSASGFEDLPAAEPAA